MMKVVLVGSGNVATHLGVALKAAGHPVIQVWSRNILHATRLADLLSSEATDDFSALNGDGDIYILSVSDDIIPALAERFPFRDKLIVHTSGTVGLDVLYGSSDTTGVFYPLQTFSKQKPVNFKDIPVAVEGSSEQVAISLLSLASSISDHAQIIDSAKRKILHVAAVVACNFSNHMYALAEKILKEENLSFDLIRPLIAETAAKALEFSPSEVQTGPASRKDTRTIDSHLSYLANKDAQIFEIYRLLTESILRSALTPKSNKA